MWLLSSSLGQQGRHSVAAFESPPDFKSSALEVASAVVVVGALVVDVESAGLVSLLGLLLSAIFLGEDGAAAAAAVVLSLVALLPALSPVGVVDSLGVSSSSSE